MSERNTVIRSGLVAAVRSMTSPTAPGRSRVGSDPQPMLLPPRPQGRNVVVKLFVVVPFLALAAAVPLAWGWGLTWTDVGLAVFFYFLTVAGITVGYHRYFTHRSFKADRPLRIGLAIVGSMALQGPVITWVAEHRRHHAFADKEGDPHSPWLFGTSAAAVVRGFWHSHFGWMFRARADQSRPLRPRPARRSRHRPDQSPVPRLDGAVSLLAPGRARRAAQLVLVGRADRLLLGRAGAGRRAAPRHVVGQLASAT